MSDFGGMRTTAPGTSATIGGDFEPTPAPAPAVEARFVPQTAIPAPAASAEPVAEKTRWVKLPTGIEVEVYESVPFAFLVDLITAQASLAKARKQGRPADQSIALSAMAEMISGALVDPDGFDTYMKNRVNKVDAKMYSEIVLALANAIASGQTDGDSGKA